MKTLAAILISFLLISSSSAQEVCEGTKQITVDRNEQFALCWIKNPEPDVQGYIIKKSMTPGLPGDEFTTILHTECKESICEAGPLSINEVGTYYFKVYAYDAATTGSASNEVILIIEDKAPSSPSGCSIRIF